MCLKPNQVLKYLNKGSCHTLSCFKAVTRGVCKRLSKLTSINTSNADLTLNDLYPSLFKPLTEAELIRNVWISSLKEQQSLRELFQGNLTTKLNEGQISSSFVNRNCNCRDKTKCTYDRKCRHPMVVHQATCLTTGKKHIGNTQQFVKKCIQQHVQDVKSLILHDKKSDSLLTTLPS